MLRQIAAYILGCLALAWRGSISSALNWASIVGVGVVGATLERRGSPMNDPHTWQGIVGWTVIYTAVAWTIIFAIRSAVVAPFQMYREQKNRADALEGLRQIANDASRPPSFDIGFEYTPFDPEKKHHLSSLSIQHSPLRIWVENIEGRPIDDCRVAIENFGPDSPIKSGVMLLADNRDDEQKSAMFDLAATEKRFFKFIDLDVYPGRMPDNRYERYGHTDPGSPTEYVFKLRSDQEGRGLASFFSKAKLDLGKQYFATIVVHGKNANSRRIDLTIETMADGVLHVAEADSTASYRKEVSHEKQN